MSKFIEIQTEDWDADDPAATAVILIQVSSIASIKTRNRRVGDQTVPTVHITLDGGEGHYVMNHTYAELKRMLTTTANIRAVGVR